MKNYRLATLVAALILWSVAAFGQATEVKLMNGETVTVEVLEKHLQSLMKAEHIPALSIAIINDGDIVYRQALGTGDLSHPEPITEKSIFEAASLSKPMFAYFALKNVEKGLLDLDRPLYEYLPHPGIDSASRETYRRITARMVLSHSTGFPNWSHGQPITLAHTPGEGFSYSGEAYQYLAAIIGQLNGVGFKEDLNQVFVEDVAGPLGLAHSSYTWNDYLAAHKVTGHQNGEPTDRASQGQAFGAGYSLHTEAGEYAAFLAAILNGEGLRDDLLQLMLTEENHFSEEEHLKQEIGQTGWTLGFAIKPGPNGTMYQHTGNNHDFQAYAMIIPENKFGIVFFTNSDKMESLLEGLSAQFGPLF